MSRVTFAKTDWTGGALRDGRGSQRACPTVPDGRPRRIHGDGETTRDFLGKPGCRRVRRLGWGRGTKLVRISSCAS